jgi:uncharacterized membrane protein YqiK
VVTPYEAETHDMSHDDLLVYQVSPDRVGIVTMLDGRTIPAGDLAGPAVEGHDSFQRGQGFLDAGGCSRTAGRSAAVRFVEPEPVADQVEQVPLTEIPLGYVGVVVSYVGREHLDVSGDTFTHGDLVERGRKGVWVEALLPGKHPINSRVMKVELVPTTEHRAELGTAHRGASLRRAVVVDQRPVEGRLLVQPRRVADHPHRHEERAARDLARRLDAEPGRSRAAADGRQLLPQLGAGGDGARLLWARSERQAEAFENIKKAIEAYDVECIDTLIGDIAPPADLMKTQTRQEDCRGSRADVRSAAGGAGQTSVARA